MIDIEVLVLSILVDELIKRTSFMFDEIISKTIHTDKEGDQKRKKK